ncbi:gamma-glutamyltransferase family protein [Henriciella sp.]|uniref:gamma-glutamyltransferase family protein n=1 Tax=Henriciella sp. TaxID=1968823 RepID=UPI00262CE21D|nr:gamma-glutamyltransferase family protein [Henriciella sp.]
MKPRFFLPALTMLLALPACQPEPSAPAGGDTQPSEETSAPVREWTKGGMVAAADPRAVQAGLDVLEEGGTAVDAAIAVHTVLGLVEPQSSGIGGGAFMVYYDFEDDRLTVFDGRETAPMAADENLFIEDGEVLDYVTAWQSGRSAGVPGMIALYKTAHEAEGKADWAKLFQSAISLAEEGFEVSPRLAGLLANERLRGAMQLDDHETSAAYFYPDGEPLQVGFVRDNPDYAATLRAVAEEGPDAFYTGDNAKAIVAALSADPLPGAMTVEDLAGYKVKTRPALCGEHKAVRICSAPPPSSGGITQNMIYGLYNRMLPVGGDLAEEDVLLAWVEAQRLAYADRDYYVGDADFVQVPSEDLINPDYLDARAGQGGAMDATPQPGDPGEVLGRGPMLGIWGRDMTDEKAGTTHISIVDPYGNAVSMTATVESAFGDSRMVNGYLLNNQLTDFSRQPRINGKLVANAPAAGKRPRSSMSPTIVFDKAGDLLMVTGSPGGNSIVAYVSKTIIGVLEWNLTAQDAINLPNVIARGKSVGVEVDVPKGQEWADVLSAMGYPVEERSGENSGLHVIVVRDKGLEGGADPRREGVAKAILPQD